MPERRPYLKVLSAVAGLLAVGAASSGAAAADDPLKGIRFPDGLTIVPGDRVWTVSEAKARLDAALAGQPVESDVRVAADRSSWSIVHVVAANPKGLTSQEICDRIVSLYMAPLMQPLPATFKSFVLELDDRVSGQKSACRYSLVQRVALVDPATPTKMLAPEQFQLFEAAPDLKIPISFLYDMSHVGLDQPARVVMGIIPEASAATPSFVEKAEIAAAAIQRRFGGDGRRTMLVAAPQGEGGAGFRLPARKLLTLSDPNIGLVFVGNVDLQVSRAEGQDPVRFILVEALHPELQRGFGLEGKDGKPLFNYDSLFVDARMALDIIGARVAAEFGVDRVHVVYSEQVQSTQARYTVPVIFERAGDDWRIVNKGEPNQ